MAATFVRTRAVLSEVRWIKCQLLALAPAPMQHSTAFALTDSTVAKLYHHRQNCILATREASILAVSRRRQGRELLAPPKEHRYRHLVQLQPAISHGGFPRSSLSLSSSRRICISACPSSTHPCPVVRVLVHSKCGACCASAQGLFLITASPHLSPATLRPD